MEIEISVKEDMLKQKQCEHAQLCERYTTLEERYAPRTYEDKSIPVCGSCHLRISKGHNKKNCRTTCTDIKQCGNLDFHKADKNELKDLASMRDATLAEIKKLKHEIATKEIAYKSISSSFAHRVKPFLIENNPAKYLFNGYKERLKVINGDIAILRQHYSGVVPDNLDIVSKTWPALIECYMEKQLKAPIKNPVRDMLENNPVYNVNIPKTSASQHFGKLIL